MCCILVIGVSEVLFCCVFVFFCGVQVLQFAAHDALFYVNLLYISNKKILYKSEERLVLLGRIFSLADVKQSRGWFGLGPSVYPLYPRVVRSFEAYQPSRNLDNLC